MRVLDLTGQKFGKLTALERVQNSAKGDVMWRCRRECGAEIIASRADLRNGHKVFSRARFVLSLVGRMVAA